MRKLTVFVIAETATDRKRLRDLLNSMEHIEVVGHSSNAETGLMQIQALRPNVALIGLDFCDQLMTTVLPKFRDPHQLDGVICASDKILKSGMQSLAGIGSNLASFIHRPLADADPPDLEQFALILTEKLAEIANTQSRKSSDDLSFELDEDLAELEKLDSADWQTTINQLCGNDIPEVVVIGVSTGGPAALTKILPELPEDLPVPVIVVQHMPADFTTLLAKDLDAICRLDVREAKDGERLKAGTIRIAPGGRQTKVSMENNHKLIHVTDDPPENFCIPSVDYLFRSVASVFKGRAVAVVLTGMGNDGTEGSRLIRLSGGKVISEAEETCVVYGMPRSVEKAGYSDHVLPLQRISKQINKLLKREHLNV